MRENFPCRSHPIYHRHPEITCPAEFLRDREHVKGVKLRIPELCSRLSLTLPLSADPRRGEGLTLTVGRQASFSPSNRRPRDVATRLAAGNYQWKEDRQATASIRVSMSSSAPHRLRSKLCCKLERASNLASNDRNYRVYARPFRLCKSLPSERIIKIYNSNVKRHVQDPFLE